MPCISPKNIAMFLAACALGGMGSARARADDAIFALRFSGLTGGDSPTVEIRSKNSAGVWKRFPLVAVGNSERFRPDGLQKCVSDELKSIGQQMQVPALNRYGQTETMDILEITRTLRNSKQFMNRPFRGYLYMQDEPTPGGLSGLNAPKVDPKFLFDFHELPPGWRASGSENIPKNIRGGLWLIGGQSVQRVPQFDRADVNMEPLPWMLDPNYQPQLEKSLAEYIAFRQKYKLIWEIGRAVSTGPRQFQEMMGAAGTDMLSELFHYGGYPNPVLMDSAAVMTHSVTEDGYNAMMRRFPDEGEGPNKKTYIYKRPLSGGNPYDAVFLIPLSKYLEAFPPKKYSAEHALFDRLRTPPISPLKIEHFIQMISYFANTPLDFKYRGKETIPLQFNAANSGTMGSTMANLANAIGLSTADLDRLEAQGYTPYAGASDPFMPGVIVDPAMPYVFSEDPAFKKGQLKAFQVSNLDPTIAAKDPEYAKAALVAAFDHLIRSFDPRTHLSRYSPEVGDFANQLRTHNVQFMLTTHYPKTAAVLETLGAELSPSYKLAKNAHAQAYWNQMKIHAKIDKPSDTERAFFFSIDQVLRFRDDFYRRAESDPSALPRANPGVYWHLSGILSP